MDIVTVSVLDAAVNSWLASPTEALIIDLSAATYVDANGLQQLIRAHGRKAGARVAVVVTDQETTKTLAVTGLDQRFKLVATRELAFAAVNEAND